MIRYFFCIAANFIGTKKSGLVSRISLCTTRMLFNVNYKHFRQAPEFFWIGYNQTVGFIFAGKAISREETETQFQYLPSYRLTGKYFKAGGLLKQYQKNKTNEYNQFYYYHFGRSISA